jgi:hypothetical protein|tara:strand:+ start:333 stop:596 length:264 start_codon:yes stop_codon:yes gene_type:complete
MIVEIILGVVILTEGYVIWNLMRKTELLESWVEEFTDTIDSVNNEIKTIDALGSFESDDETGAIFKQIQETINRLNTLRGEDVDDTK